jgi:hypothetical protein
MDTKTKKLIVMGIFTGFIWFVLTTPMKIMFDGTIQFYVWLFFQTLTLGKIKADYDKEGK